MTRTFKTYNASVAAKAPVWALLMAVFIALTSLTVRAQEEAPFDGRSLPEKPEKTLEFSFENEEWKEVISWFADETGLSWQAISNPKFPTGTFTLDDKKEYTPFEALDQLNYALRLIEPPYTIIRNRDQLILTQASRDLPFELVPIVTSDELDQRGDYETLSCQFDLGVLDLREVEADLLASVNSKYTKQAKALPSLNAFFARGTGADLKNIRRTIQALTSAKKRTLKAYTLKHYDPEQFLMSARVPLKIDSESNERADGTLGISVDLSTGRLYVHGTPLAHREFAEVVELLDVPPAQGNAGMVREYIKSYAITTDPEMTRKVVETQLDGTTATIGQNEITGAIILRGTEAHHKIAQDVINTIQGEDGSTKIVELENASATTILEAVSSLLNISPTSPDSANAPRLLANTSQNYIMIHGSPQQIYKISEMIKQLDQAQGRDPNRIRTNARVIEMSEEKRDELLNSVQDYWPTTGRKNTLRIIMPDEKVQDKLDNRRRMVIPEDSSTGIRFPRREKKTVQRRGNVRTVAYQQIVEKTPEEAQLGSSKSVGGRYMPPTEIKSVPGAELKIKATPFGVLIESDDLDALDDLEDIFRAQTLDEDVEQGFTVFYLKYRDAPSVQAALEQMFGLASGSDGGGGGDLMSGIMDNVAGEGTGDLFGGLLGGSSSSSSGGAIELAGDVQIGSYVPMNLLYVGGATASDLTYIQDAIDLFDQSSAPQNPELVGQFFAISILHRSPQSVFDQISNLWPEYIAGAPAAEGNAGGGNGGKNGMNQVAEMVRGMAGGKGGGNKGATTSEEAPKARISLDEETGQILVVGPKFIYEQILKSVERIDTPDLSATKSYEMMSRDSVSPEALQLMKDIFGAKLKLSDDDVEGESDSDQQSQNGRNGQSNQGANSKASESRADQIRQQIFNGLNNGGNNRANGGQRGGGNQRTGGGGQRGGGGGQRGGGGGGRR